MGLSTPENGPVPIGDVVAKVAATMKKQALASHSRQGHGHSTPRAHLQCKDTPESLPAQGEISPVAGGEAQGRGKRVFGWGPCMRFVLKLAIPEREKLALALIALRASPWTQHRVGTLIAYPSRAEIALAATRRGRPIARGTVSRLTRRLEEEGYIQRLWGTSRAGKRMRVYRLAGPAAYAFEHGVVTPDRHGVVTPSITRVVTPSVMGVVTPKGHTEVKREVRREVREKGSASLSQIEKQSDTRTATAQGKRHFPGGTPRSSETLDRIVNEFAEAAKWSGDRKRIREEFSVLPDDFSEQELLTAIRQKVQPLMKPWEFKEAMYRERRRSAREQVEQEPIQDRAAFDEICRRIQAGEVKCLIGEETGRKYFIRDVVNGVILIETDRGEESVTCDTVHKFRVPTESGEVDVQL